jgi:hypothetical protein
MDQFFIKNRIIQLKFDRKIATKIAINIGILQGWPVSPILFLLYIRNLSIKTDRRSTAIPSYIHDITIITRSKSIAVNNVILKGTAEKLIEEGKNQNIKFDITKTELIHFYNQKRALPGKLIITINCEIVTISAKKKLNGSVFGSIEY